MKTQHADKKLGRTLAFILIPPLLILSWLILAPGLVSTTPGKHNPTLSSSQSANYRITADILVEGGGVRGYQITTESLTPSVMLSKVANRTAAISGCSPALSPALHGGSHPNPNTITHPPDGAITAAPSITVTGNTAAGASILISTREDVYTTTAEDNGNYMMPGVTLILGPNTIESQSTDVYGNRATASIAITRTTYFLTGTLLSRVRDAGQPVTWETITWRADTPAGTSIVFRTRTGNTEPPPDSGTCDGTWSCWSEAYTTPGQAINSPPGRYIQYEALLSTTDGLASPALEDVTISYDVIPTPALSIAGYAIDDDTFDQSYGNNDGIANPGEFLEIHLSLTNTGQETASNVVIHPTTTSPYVNPYGAYFYDSSLDFGDIASGETVTRDDFDFVLSSDTPDGTTITFDLEITDGTDTWADSFDLLVSGSDTTLPDIGPVDVGPAHYIPVGNPANIVAFIREGGQSHIRDG